ncbi:TIGR04141 family sporadically distributed protein [Saccharothrix hoggarensis]|uniref:TIGR04141 family sporadically distributed protein n=1 Tax=Saccharothrix hoggarensis TaxID=913853 RepID=A0ABW3R156_9PSEU
MSTEYDGPITINGARSHWVAETRVVDSPLRAEHVIRISDQELALTSSAPFICLDKSRARTPMHPEFELAGVIGPDDERVHVKWLTRATAASHLVTRARVSAWARRLEPAALEQLDAKVNTLDGRRRVTERSRVVVPAIAGRRWDVARLFALSPVEPLRLNEDPRHHGVEPRFADLPFVAKRKGAARPADGQAA